MKNIIPDLVYQEETNECGLACIAMLAQTQGISISLEALRDVYPASEHGTSLIDLSTILTNYGVATTPILFEHHELNSLPLPAILHYGANHFVVLAYRKGSNVCVMNPAIGQQWLPFSALKAEISGYALILEPEAALKKIESLAPENKQNISIGRKVPHAMSLKETAAVRGIYGLMALVFLVSLTLFLMPAMVSNAINQAFSDAKNAVFPYGWFIVAFIVATLLALAVRMISERFVKHFVLINSGVGFSRLLSNPLRFFEKRAPGDVFSRFVAWQGALTEKIELDNGLRTDWIICAIALGVMFWIAPVLAAISAAGVTVMGLISVWAIIRDRWYTQQLQLKAAELNDFFMETLQGILTIKTAGLENQRKTQFAWLSRELFTCMQRRNVYQQIKDGIYQLTGSLEMVIFMLVVLPMVANDLISLGDFFAYSFLRQIFTTYVTRIFYAIIHKSQLHVIDTRVHSLFPKKSEENNVPFQEKYSSGKAPHLTFEHIYFNYDPAKPILHDISLDLPSGIQVAIVGESGAGKSTLLRIIAGLFAVQKGECRSKDDLVSTMQLTQLVCLQSQEDILFNATVLENITLFDPNFREKDRKIIEELLENLALGSVINSLPGGLSSLIRESNSSLSLGQRQRLLLARSLYSARPILLLDEPTANLDVETAKTVMQTIQSHCRETGKTLIVVTHNDDIAASFDSLYRIVDGQLSQQFTRGDIKPKATNISPTLVTSEVLTQ
ncbi:MULTISPECIES: peptidase domain-containing ABC transporter [Providencia]|uniref:peptidase domain-containing ABC transporter n=1 Tax=Providencia TaxID=586 RepID=UPI00083959E7|nr:cysteine peptidase family C39 domain-containing protein [Providencia heimbachae]MBP6123391.1 ATP-binding cassette domain-containing protein [Providencia sp.]NIH24006.1 ATP-binding cassette domain-containing protein [Providencia heimbachae]